MTRDEIIAEKALSAALPFLCEKCQEIIEKRLKRIRSKIAEKMAEFLEL